MTGANASTVDVDRVSIDEARVTVQDGNAGTIEQVLVNCAEAGNFLFLGGDQRRPRKAGGR